MKKNKSIQNDAEAADNNFLLIENKLLKEQIVKLNLVSEEIQERNSQRERLINILSHDIYSPLRFSTMVGKAILSKKEELNKAEILDALADINQTCTGAILLISNILKWVEYQKNNFAPNYSDENLHQLVADKIDFFQLMASSKNIHLLNNIPTDVFIKTDKIAFGIIIQNLLNNAIKFTPDGEVEVNIIEGLNFIKINFSDTGDGMSIQTIESIKKNIEIKPTTDAENRKGNGLGWGLIRDLLKHINGSFDIKSGENTGTTVTITLPI
jgi:signal transduction histidine kinase